MAKYQVALNADMGESFGHYKLGNDELLMEYLSTANLACGFHAADPMVMQESVGYAKKHGVSVGAHPGFKDMQGFGRRMMNISPEEMYADTIYQMGALNGFLMAQGMEMTHVCPHGLLDPMVSEHEEYAELFVKAVKDFKADMKIICEDNCALTRVAAKEKIAIARVGYPDLKYDAKGNYYVEKVRKPMDPDEIAEQSVRMIVEGRAKSVDGQFFPVKVDVLSYHSDVPNALEIMQAVHKALKAEGVEIVGF